MQGGKGKVRDKEGLKVEKCIEGREERFMGSFADLCIKWIHL